MTHGRAGVDAIAEQLEQLPVQPAVAAEVVGLADEAASSTADLMSAITADPSLTARVLKLANSAYYDLSGKVGNIGLAVSVIGFPTVRAMAAATASGLFTDGRRIAPKGFWHHSLAVAAAASKLADRGGLRPADAFSLGLLHDVGTALLFRGDADRYEAVVRDSVRDGVALTVVEHREFGIAHDEAAAQVFALWRFPQFFVDAVRMHHVPVDHGADGAAHVLWAAEAVAARLPSAPMWELPGRRDAGLDALGLSPLEAARLASAVREESSELLSAFA